MQHCICHNLSDAFRSLTYHLVPVLLCVAIVGMCSSSLVCLRSWRQTSTRFFLLFGNQTRKKLFYSSMHVYFFLSKSQTRRCHLWDVTLYNFITIPTPIFSFIEINCFFLSLFLQIYLSHFRSNLKFKVNFRINLFNIMHVFLFFVIKKIQYFNIIRKVKIWLSKLRG